nr:MAG TPA: NTP-PPase-like protein [Caudoviricetes sp.]
MTGTEFQEKAMRTAAASDSGALLLNGVMGLNGEAGECIDIMKKYLFQGHELDEEKLMDELSDVMWYAAITATGLGVTLDEVMEHNVEKLKNRYPDGFDKDRSIHREG